MVQRLTTICCSAFALICWGIAPIFAETKPAAPLSLFPVEPVWTLSLKNSLEAPPAFDGNLGFFAIEGHRLVAYDLDTGTQQWLVDSQVVSPPVADEGLLFVVEPDAIVARKYADGAPQWRVEFSDELAAPLAAANGWLIAATKSGNLLAFRAADGGLIWKQPLPAHPQSPPALAADRVYIGTDDHLVLALGLQKGDVLWRRSLGGVANRILPLADRVFVGSDDNYFYALRPRTGAVEWRWPTGADVIGLPVVDDDRVYFVSLDNVLRGLDRNIGNQRWKRVLPLRPSRGPVRAGNTLLVSGVTSKVYAFSTKDGGPVGDVTADSGLAAAPYVRDVGGVPVLTLVSSDLAEGAIVKTYTRSFEPRVVPLGPLPITVTLPTQGGPPATPEPGPLAAPPSTGDREKRTNPSP